MKMMLWKEFRENFKWAVLALLALTMAEFYVLSSENANFQSANDNDITLCSSSFLLVTSFGSAVIGAALGVVQILPELRRDVSLVAWCSQLRGEDRLLLRRIPAGHDAVDH